jgi:hypothetical protein
MQIKKELIKREIAGDVILVPVGQTVLNSNGLFVLNELGGFLWDRLPQAETADDLLRAVLDEYMVDETTAKADIEEFLQQLQKLDII